MTMGGGSPMVVGMPRRLAGRDPEVSDSFGFVFDANGPVKLPYFLPPAGVDLRTFLAPSPSWALIEWLWNLTPPGACVIPMGGSASSPSGVVPPRARPTRAARRRPQVADGGRVLSRPCGNDDGQDRGRAGLPRRLDPCGRERLAQRPALRRGRAGRAHGARGVAMGSRTGERGRPSAGWHRNLRYASALAGWHCRETCETIEDCLSAVESAAGSRERWRTAAAAEAAREASQRMYAEQLKATPPE